VSEWVSGAVPSLTLAEGHKALLHGVADVDLEGRDHLSVEARVRVRSGEVWAGSGQAHGGARSRREEQRVVTGSESE
jgi:hypothetical protein